VNVRSAAVVLGAVVTATAADLVVGAKQPGLIPVFTLLASVALVLVAKWLSRNGLQVPSGSRAGEVGDPADTWDAARDDVEEVARG
jgi:hypothetical protein